MTMIYREGGGLTIKGTHSLPCSKMVPDIMIDDKVKNAIKIKLLSSLHKTTCQWNECLFVWHLFVVLVGAWHLIVCCVVCCCASTS